MSLLGLKEWLQGSHGKDWSGIFSRVNQAAGNIIVLQCCYFVHVLIMWSQIKCSKLGDKHLISPYSITSWSNIKVTRIKEMSTKHYMSWCNFYLGWWGSRLRRRGVISGWRWWNHTWWYQGKDQDYTIITLCSLAFQTFSHCSVTNWNKSTLFNKR